jgi:hypothetical protein
MLASATDADCKIRIAGLSHCNGLEKLFYPSIIVGNHISARERFGYFMLLAAAPGGRLF